MSATRTAKVQQQHLRLLDGLAASVREKGLAQTHVSDIVRHARASRRTFYKHFSDKDSCLVELVHLSTTTIIETVTAATDLTAPRTLQIEQAIDAYLSILSSEPELALALSSPSVGERIVRAQRDGLERFAEFLVALTADTPEGGASPTPVSVECAYMLASGLRATALRAIERGDPLDRAGTEGKALLNAVLCPRPPAGT
ncbi:MAG: TetR/AcrR family transcriptional regulator [Mycobacterium sp.]